MLPQANKWKAEREAKRKVEREVERDKSCCEGCGLPNKDYIMLQKGLCGTNAELSNAWATAERAEAELTKYRTKFADSMCAECMLYGIDCDCDALKEGE